MLQIRAYQEPDESAVIALWQRCELVKAWNDPRKDIARKLAVQRELFLVGVADGSVVASVMLGYEGHRGWMNYLAVDPAFRRRGFGGELVAYAERVLLAAGCPKLNLQVRASNALVIEFYRRLGYVEEDRVSLGKRLQHDE